MLEDGLVSEIKTYRKKVNNSNVEKAIGFQEIITLLKAKSRNNDLILNMGAGNINTIPNKLLGIVDNTFLVISFDLIVCYVKV